MYYSSKHSTQYNTIQHNTHTYPFTYSLSLTLSLHKNKKTINNNNIQQQQSTINTFSFFSFCVFVLTCIILFSKMIFNLLQLVLLFWSRCRSICSNHHCMISFVRFKCDLFRGFKVFFLKLLYFFCKYNFGGSG